MCEFLIRVINLMISGKLPAEFYKKGGIHSSSLSAQDRTSYRWKFKGITELELDSVRDAVDTDSWDRKWSDMKEETDKKIKKYEAGSEDEDENQTTLNREKERKRNKLEEKKFIKRKEAALDEIAPKPDPGSFKARLDKKRATHRRPDDMDDEYGVSDDIMGGDFDEERLALKKSLERQRSVQQKRADVIQKKAEEYRARETATVEAFRQQLGLTDRFASKSVEKYEL
jgi:hypothetical protein